MEPLERVLSAMSFKEPDKVPLMQQFTFYGAKELGISIKDYFLNPDNIVEAQALMQKKYSNDCFNGFLYASVEHEAFGGDTIFIEDGPPNSGMPVIRSVNDIEKLKVPLIEESLILQRVLTTIRKLKKEADGTIPIIGVVVSPFSLPVMQMGFDKYLELMIRDPMMFEKLMSINKKFCIQWANAQLEAGANAICYFDPVSSPTIIPVGLYKRTGWQIAREVIKEIDGPTATHFASGRILPVLDELAETGTKIIAPSSQEDIGEVKEKAQNRVAVIGNLNGIEMCRWSIREAEDAVKDIVVKAGKGGGLLLSDNHGEIPFQVPQKVLLAIAASVEKYGVYN